MKRLIKKANMTVYHATDIDNMDSITQMGKLVPNEGVGMGSFDRVLKHREEAGIPVNDPRDKSIDTYNGWIFCSTNIWYSTFLLNERDGGSRYFAILELDVPNDIVVQDPDDPTNSQSFAIQGEVPTNYVKKVSIWDREKNGYAVQDATMSDWKQKLDEYDNSEESKGPFYL